MASRWADTEEDAAEDARRKAEKEEKKKRLKAEKQRRAEEAQKAAAAKTNGHAEDDSGRPTKRRRLSEDGAEKAAEVPQERKLLRFNAPTWQPTRSIERFDRLNHIEEGSYGFVSRAREEATGEIVAIKKLKMDPVRDGGFPVTALREIQTLQASKHRHIVNLREVVNGQGESAADVYLVMDFLEHDLKTLQEEMEEPFLPSETKTLMLQLGSAVDFLHTHWILHRDLKTSNILLNNRGEIKLADFGMARFVGNPAPNNLTQLVVTLWYRSPELLLGTTTYDSAVDMWSLGCIFGELLTRQPLLSGKNEVEQLSKVSQAPSLQERETGKKQIPSPYSVIDFTPIDLRTLRHTHRGNLAGFQAPPERTNTSFSNRTTGSGLDCAIQIPYAHECWRGPHEQSAVTQSREETEREGDARAPLFCREPAAEAHCNVSHVS